jgi:hypothetical protein
MTAYRVTLFKQLLSSDGHPRNCLQYLTEIRRARSPERAVEAARLRYQRAHRTPDWMMIADVVETEASKRTP